MLVNEFFIKYQSIERKRLQCIVMREEEKRRSIKFEKSHCKFLKYVTCSLYSYMLKLKKINSISYKQKSGKEINKTISFFYWEQFAYIVHFFFFLAESPCFSESSECRSRSPSPTPSSGLENTSIKDSPMQIDTVVSSADNSCNNSGMQCVYYLFLHLPFPPCRISQSFNVLKSLKST